MGRHGRAPAAQGAPVDPDELRRRGLPPGDRHAATGLPVGDADAEGAGADRGAVLGGPRRPLLLARRFPASLATGHRVGSPAGSPAPGDALEMEMLYMLVLGIETSTPQAPLTIGSEQGIIRSCTISRGVAYCETHLPVIE